MDDHVSVVEQHPSAGIGALDRPGAFADLFGHPLLDRVDDRLHLPVVGPGGEHEVLAQTDHRADVQHDDVGGELVLSRVGRDQSGAPRLVGGGRGHDVRSEPTITLTSTPPELAGAAVAVTPNADAISSAASRASGTG